MTDLLEGTGLKGFRYGYGWFRTALADIKSDLEANDPVIALVAWSLTKMHYLNVVGVSADDDVAVLDTDNTLGYFSMSDFKYRMDVSNIYVVSDNYVIIRFGKC